LPGRPEARVQVEHLHEGSRSFFELAHLDQHEAVHVGVQIVQPVLSIESVQCRVDVEGLAVHDGRLGYLYTIVLLRLLPLEDFFFFALVAVHVDAVVVQEESCGALLVFLGELEDERTPLEFSLVEETAGELQSVCERRDGFDGRGHEAEDGVRVLLEVLLVQRRELGGRV
jgi:hypothetical protein